MAFSHFTVTQSVGGGGIIWDGSTPAAAFDTPEDAMTFLQSTEAQVQRFFADAAEKAHASKQRDA